VSKRKKIKIKMNTGKKLGNDPDLDTRTRLPTTTTDLSLHSLHLQGKHVEHQHHNFTYVMYTCTAPQVWCTHQTMRKKDHKRHNMRERKGRKIARKKEKERH
jgi:hypothetical protein